MGSYEKVNIFRRISWIVVDVLSLDKFLRDIISMVTSPPFVDNFHKNIIKSSIYSSLDNKRLFH